jgi:hypothetical protein
MNSTAAGSESLLHPHSIYYAPSGNIQPGDTILLRFRLFSDPFANGWGWIIEDLKINPFVDAVEKVSSESPVKIYPNPGQGLFRMSADPGINQAGRPMHYYIYNANGICISSGNLRGDMENVIDISDRPAGIYIIVLNRDDWIRTIKYSLIK